MEEGEVIQHSMMTKSIERAQKKVEENNSNSSDVDFISIDSVFTPIINVKYNKPRY